MSLETENDKYFPSEKICKQNKYWKAMNMNRKIRLLQKKISAPFWNNNQKQE
jgi:hypothetical protein